MLSLAVELARIRSFFGDAPYPISSTTVIGDKAPSLDALQIMDGTDTMHAFNSLK